MFTKLRHAVPHVVCGISARGSASAVFLSPWARRVRNEEVSLLAQPPRASSNPSGARATPHCTLRPKVLARVYLCYGKPDLSVTSTSPPGRCCPTVQHPPTGSGLLTSQRSQQPVRLTGHQRPQTTPWPPASHADPPHTSYVHYTVLW